MTVIDIIEKSLEYNYLCLRLLNGEKWLLENKDSPRFNKMILEVKKIIKKMSDILKLFDEMNIDHGDRNILYGIDIPYQFKRVHIEIILDKMEKKMQNVSRETIKKDTSN